MIKIESINIDCRLFLYHFFNFDFKFKILFEKSLEKFILV